MPLQAQIREFRQGRALFVQQLVQAAALLACAGAGLALDGVVGLAWGLAPATVIALVAIVARALRLERPAVGTVVAA